VGGGGACFAASSAANEPSRKSGAGGGSNCGGAKLPPPSVEPPPACALRIDERVAERGGELERCGELFLVRGEMSGGEGSPKTAVASKSLWKSEDRMRCARFTDSTTAFTACCAARSAASRAVLSAFCARAAAVSARCALRVELPAFAPTAAAALSARAASACAALKTCSACWPIASFG